MVTHANNGLILPNFVDREATESYTEVLHSRHGAEDQVDDCTAVEEEIQREKGLKW